MAMGVDAPHPAPGDLREAESRCLALRHRLLHSSLAPSSYRSLLRRVDSEVRFLSRHSTSLPLCSNVGYFESVVRLLLHPSIQCISLVSKRLTVPAPAAAEHSVHVDLVCTFHRRPAWFVVSDRTPAGLSWFGNDGLRVRVERVTSAARSARALKPASVFFVFARGVRDSVAGNLVNDFGAVEVDLFKDEDVFEELENGWTGVWSDTGNSRVFEIRIGTDNKRDAVCSMKTVDVRVEMGGSNDGFGSLIAKLNSEPVDVLNFDKTTLITMVSEISNGGCDRLLKVPEAEMRARFKDIYESVMAQITSELQNPVLAELADAIAGKKVIICESVHSKFQEVVRMHGGPNERLRAGQLLKLLQVVPDSPSERVMDLPTTKRITLNSKIVFGTGDHWQAPTLTANRGFVRAVSMNSMSLLTIEHRFRALTGD